MTKPITGGCQCGAIRFRATSFGRASLCHCRMCQKAFGSIGGLLVTAHDLVWTRGNPAHFQSSDAVRRGFCRDCGTPLTFEPQGGAIEIAMAAFDDPSAIEPTIQLDRANRIAWFDGLHALPEPDAAEQARKEAGYARIVSHQHPDHDTDRWPPAKGNP